MDLKFSDAKHKINTHGDESIAYAFSRREQHSIRCHGPSYCVTHKTKLFFFTKSTRCHERPYTSLSSIELSKLVVAVKPLSALSNESTLFGASGAGFTIEQDLKNAPSCTVFSDASVGKPLEIVRGIDKSSFDFVGSES